MWEDFEAGRIPVVNNVTLITPMHPPPPPPPHTHTHRGSGGGEGETSIECSGGRPWKDCHYCGTCVNTFLCMCSKSHKQKQCIDSPVCLCMALHSITLTPRGILFVNRGL